MVLFTLTLLVMRFASDIPDGAGGTPKEKPPDLVLENRLNHATAFYWEMYGATVKAHNANITGG